MWSTYLMGDVRVYTYAVHIDLNTSQSDIFLWNFILVRFLFQNWSLDGKKNQNFGIPALLNRAVVNITQIFKLI